MHHQASFDRYYDTGIPWFGRIPAHWKLQRLRSAFDAYKNGIWGNDPGEDETDVVCVRVADFDRERLEVEFAETKRSIAFSQYNDYVIAKDSLLIEKSGGGDKQPVGVMVSFKLAEPAICSNFIAKLDVNDLFSSRFIVYVCSLLYRSQIVTRSIKQTTGIQNLDLNQYLDEVICVPPLNEQQAIADYLDSETTKIDKLIAEYTTLLAQLNRKRSATISHGVTGGLSSGIPTRDPMIEWLNEIPESWEVVSLRFLADVRSGITKGRKLKGRQTISVPYLRVANVQDGYVDLSDISEIEATPEEVERYRLKPGDVLMNEGGDADKLGRGAVWDGSIDPCLHQNHVFAVRCHSVDPEWLSAFTSSHFAKGFFESRSKQSTNLASISATNLKELPVVLPPQKDRIRILAEVEQRLSNIDELCTETLHSIELMQKRREAIIAAVVTGKVRITD